MGKDTIAGSNIISYEDTVLFLVSIFQYVVTAIAFSVAKPFRKPIYTNIPFLLSIILITAVNVCFVFLPNPGVDDQNTQGSNWLDNFFLIEPFTKDGESFYTYRFYLALGIVVNSVTTLLWEKCFIVWLTQMFDQKTKEKKDKKFLDLMLNINIK